MSAACYCYTLISYVTQLACSDNTKAYSKMCVSCSSHFSMKWFRFKEITSHLSKFTIS